MKKSLFVACFLNLAMVASHGFSASFSGDFGDHKGGRGQGNSGDRDYQRTTTYLCIGESRDDSSQFALGVGPSRAEALVQVLERCVNRNLKCSVSCEARN